MRTRSFAALAVTVLTMATESAQAIDDGRPDGNEHGNVGLLAFDPDGPGETPPVGICTGTVLADQVFLTAAHCIEAEFVPPGSQWVVTLDPGTPQRPLMTTGFLDDYPLSALVTVDESQLERATGAVVHPEFGVGEFLANDVALVLFPAGTFSVLPVGLPPLGALDRFGDYGEKRRGPQFTFVGYGAELTEENPPRLFIGGYRKVARASFASLGANFLYLDHASAPGPHDGLLCPGDSGAPQFLGGSNQQVSLNSATEGEDGCDERVSRNQRLDTAAVQRFLARYVDLGRSAP